jgi:CheY-like chemotaxis protein
MAGMLMVVDDDPRWLDNIASTVPPAVALVFKAATPDEAVKLVRRYRFDLVILDMSMDPNDDKDRSNRPLQLYLSKRPEGTLYIILSQHLLREGMEVSDHYNDMGALSVEHKPRVDPAQLLEQIEAAISSASAGLAEEAERSRRLIIPDIYAEQQLLTTLRPSGGMASVFHVVENLLPAVSPLRAHLYRQGLNYGQDCAMLLAWSRLRGCAVIISMAASSLSVEEAFAQLSKWLGYEPKGDPFLRHELNRTRVMCWEDRDLDDEHFDLPNLHAS